MTANTETESPSATERLMESVCESENLTQALKRVCANKGAPGVDGMTVQQLVAHLRTHWQTIRTQLLEGSYRPQPVRRVEIPKPDGGIRKLGVPTVLDRFIQQALMQVLQARWDRTFSETSYGFRPGRSAHQAVAKAQSYIQAGYTWVVDLDLEKFFDRVNHDILVSRVAKRVCDKRVLKLIRAFLTAGVLENGLVGETEEGTPQGGPLSPLLSNLLLDDLDRELERRGHSFVRYADDCNVYVRSERSGLRVMEGLKAFLTNKLKLKVNEAKSAVARPEQRKFLGFTFLRGKRVWRAIAPKSLERFKDRIRELTAGMRGISFKRMVAELCLYLLGWKGYFGFSETPAVLRSLDEWVRRRLRCYLWIQWKTRRRRFEQLVRLGVAKEMAAMSASSSRGSWRLSSSPALSRGLPIRYFKEMGIPLLYEKSGN